MPVSTMRPELSPLMSTRQQQTPRLRQVSLREWRQAAVQSIRDLWAGSILEWASSLAFYGFLSVFPLVIAVLTVASMFVDAGWATRHATELLGRYLPEGDSQITDIIQTAIAERRRVGVLSLIILLVTGRRVLGVLTKGLNHVSDVDERDDPLWRKVAVELALVAGVGGLVVLTFAFRPLLELAWGTVRILPGPDTPLVAVVLGAIRVLLLLTVFVLVFGLVPRGERLWRAALAGAVMATALYMLAESLFGIVADRIWANLGLIYGPLALAALLLSWTWYVSVITLIGGGFASHVKVMILERHSATDAHQRHIGR
jgi:membrane protein